MKPLSKEPTITVPSDALVRLVRAARRLCTPIEDEGMARCDDCGLVTDSYLPLVNTQGLNERLEPGRTVPAGECRECGALVYHVHPHPMQCVRKADALTSLRYAVDNTAFDDIE